MRIAIFTESYFPFISGVVTHIKTLKDELEKKGHKVMIITSDPTSKMHYLKNGVLYCPAKSLKKVYGYGVSTPISRKRLEYIKDFNPDIVHIHTEFSMGMFGIWVAKKLNKPIVYTLHTMYDNYTFYLFPEKFDKITKPAAHAYFRNVAKKATEIIGPSLKVVEFLKRCGVNRHISIIPNVTDLTLFLPENVDKNEVLAVKNKYKILDSDIVLCFVGRLGKEKSIDTLIEYFAKSVGNKSNFKLLIIGDGPEKDYLSELISAYELQNQVFLVGKVDHSKIAAYYYASTLYATASLTEINSISMLEAMASGLMIMQRFDIYNKDQIKEGETGYFFNNLEEFSNLLNDIEDMSQQERIETREKAMRLSREYGPEEFIKKILDVYERAIFKHLTNNKNTKKGSNINKNIKTLKP